MSTSKKGSAVKGLRCKAWPDDMETVGADKIVEPLIKVIQQAFELKPKKLPTGGIQWDGLDFGHPSAGWHKDPQEALSPAGLKSAIEDGDGVLAQIFLVALNLGIEQGRRSVIQRFGDASTARFLLGEVGKAGPILASAADVIARALYLKTKEGA